MQISKGVNFVICFYLNPLNEILKCINVLLGIHFLGVEIHFLLLYNLKSTKTISEKYLSFLIIIDCINSSLLFSICINLSTGSLVIFNDFFLAAPLVD